MKTSAFLTLGQFHVTGLWIGFGSSHPPLQNKNSLFKVFAQFTPSLVSKILRVRKARLLISAALNFTARNLELLRETKTRVGGSLK